MVDILNTNSTNLTNNYLINWLHEWNGFRDIRDIRVLTIFLNTNSTNLTNDFVIFVNRLNEIEQMKGFFEHEWHGFNEWVFNQLITLMKHISWYSRYSCSNYISEHEWHEFGEWLCDFLNRLNEMELMKGERGFCGYAPVFKIIPFGHNYRTKKLAHRNESSKTSCFPTK